MTSTTRQPPNEPDGSGDEKIPLREGRTFPFAMVGQWVALSGVSDKAVRIYDILRGHINQERNDNLAWPTLHQIAEMCGLTGKERDKAVRKYIRELETLGAVEVETLRFGPNNMEKRNEYTVHLAPPDGYLGWSSYAEWHSARKARERAARRALLATTKPGPRRPRAAAQTKDSVAVS